MDRIWEPIVFVIASIILTWLFYRGLKSVVLKHDDEYKEFMEKQKEAKEKKKEKSN